MYSIYTLSAKRHSLSSGQISLCRPSKRPTDLCMCIMCICVFNIHTYVYLVNGHACAPLHAACMTTCM